MFHWNLIVGVLMMGITIAIHSIASIKWIEYVGTWKDGWRTANTARELYVAVILTALALLMLHLVEVILWAVLYVSISDQTGLTNLPEAIYFSLITFTTVGYGDITLKEGARLLSGMEAMVGIVTVGLTTAMLFVVIQRFWRLGHQRASKEK